MKRPDETSRRVLLLLRLDAQRLFERIKYREPEYMQVFSSKRTRDHFTRIFESRYTDARINDLKYCSQDVIIGLDQFYTKVNELEWYLGTTEDMPATVQDNIKHGIHELEDCYEMLQLYISAEFGITTDEAATGLESSQEGQETVETHEDLQE